MDFTHRRKCRQGNHSRDSWQVPQLQCSCISCVIPSSWGCTAEGMQTSQRVMWSGACAKLLVLSPVCCVQRAFGCLILELFRLEPKALLLLNFVTTQLEHFLHPHFYFTSHHLRKKSNQNVVDYDENSDSLGVRTCWWESTRCRLQYNTVTNTSVSFKTSLTL